MKEITFDELIKEWLLEELLSVPEKDMVKQLMQQVRESTIAECFRIANEKDSSIADEISDLPTDKIKTEK